MLDGTSGIRNGNLYAQFGFQIAKGGNVGTVSLVLLQDYLYDGFSPSWTGALPIDVDTWPFLAAASLDPRLVPIVVGAALYIDNGWDFVQTVPITNIPLTGPGSTLNPPSSSVEPFGI